MIRFASHESLVFTALSSSDAGCGHPEYQSRKKNSRRLLPRLGLLALTLLLGLQAGCDAVEPELPEEDLNIEEALPEEEPFEPEGAVERTDGGSKTSSIRWAAGYAYANDRFAASYSPLASYAFNRAGGSIRITRPSGTIGRYRVRFSGLSTYLGNKSTVQVSGHASDGGSYCNPVRPKLIDDVVEVRCFNTRGEPTSARFSILVMKNYPDVAFAHAHKPTEYDYAPAGGSSSNPHGGIRVFKIGTGHYDVRFSGLGSASDGNGRSVQVSHVGTGSRYCKVQRWSGSTYTDVLVKCYNAAGSPVNAKFNVFLATPFSNLGYASVGLRYTSSYPYVNIFESWNAGGGRILSQKRKVGHYTVTFEGLSLLDGGNAQVTAVGTGTAKCKQLGWGTHYVDVLCYAPNGTLVDSEFTVLLAS